MTQALLNNLNITKDSSFRVKDNSAKTVVTTFDKFLGTKSNSDKLNKNIEETKKSTKQNTNTNEQDKDYIYQNGNGIRNETLHKPAGILGFLQKSNAKENITEETKNAEDEKETIIENATESVLDLIIEQNSDILITDKSDNKNSSDTESINNEIIETEISEDNLEETIITEEDSTMHKEINAPEDPIAVLLLSQIQTNVNLSVSDKSESIEQDNIQMSKKDNNAELFVQKQFEDILNTKEFSAVTSGEKDVGYTKTEQSKQNFVLNEKMIKELNIESVSTDGAQDSTSDDLMQNQSPQEQTVKIMIQGDIKSDVKIEIAKTAEIKPVTITTDKIIEQISKQLEGMYNNSKLNLVLNPETLGKLHLHIVNTKDGLTAQFTVTTQDAKDIIMKGINGLKDALLAHGINVDSVSVKLEDTEGDEYSDWTEQEGSRGGNKQQDTRKQKEEEKPFEQMMFEMENNDNLV